MATGYSIEIGYNSGVIAEPEMWRQLQEAALAIADHPDVILDEVQRIEPSVDRDELVAYAEAYRRRNDATLVILQPSEDEKGSIFQSASGGGASRLLKESCRRAFSRLLIAEMHRRKIEVSFVVG